MKQPAGTRPLFRLPWRTRSQIAADVDDELAFHLEMRAQELAARGLPREAALAEAQRRFGDLEYTRHYCRDEDQGRERDTRRMTMLDELRQDLTYAVRALRSARGFTLVTLLTLAIGIGANTAIFSVVRGVLLQPLPFPQVEQLDRIWTSNPRADAPRNAFSEPDFLDTRTAARSYAAMGAYWYGEGKSTADLTGVGAPEQITGAYITDGFFETLRPTPVLGRVTRPEEHVVGNDHVVVLSWGFWQRRLGGDRSIVGRALTIDGAPYTVLGVMPRDFTYPGDRLDFWMPLSTIPPEGIGRARFSRFLDVIGRRAPGVSPERARDELTAIARRLAAQYQEDADFTAATTLPLRESILGEVRRPLFVLLGAVAFVLLMTCANVAGLLLARSSTRERELAVRAALGAGRGRIVRQLLTESVLLALVGGALGLLLAHFGVRALTRAAASELPRLHNVQIDLAVLGWSLALSLVVGLAFGVVPALRAARVDLREGLHAGARGNTSAAGQRLRAGLVVAQVAVALVLAVGATLATRSVARLLQVSPGFDPENVLTVTFSINSDRFSRDQQDAYYTGVLERVGRLPGVVAAGAAKDLPLRGVGEQVEFRVPGSSTPASQVERTAIMPVSPGYFHAMRIPLLAGRDIAFTDRRGTPTVLVVNEAFARRYWPGQSAVGRMLQAGDEQIAIVGVVGDVRQEALNEEPVPTAYVSNFQMHRSRMSLAVRTSGEPLRLANAVKNIIWSYAPDQTITRISTLDDAIGGAVARPRLVAALLVLFGLMGLALGALGLHGVLAYAVAQRRQEIGVRVALGATPATVLQLVMRQGLGLTIAGVAIGVAAALLVTRYMSALLFGVRPTDPATFAAVIATLVAVALVATLVPARRALRIPPMVAMRAE